MMQATQACIIGLSAGDGPLEVILDMGVAVIAVPLEGA